VTESVDRRAGPQCGRPGARWLAAATALLWAAPAAAQEPVEEAIEQGTRSNVQSARSQDRIDELDDETEGLLQDYRAELRQIGSLREYNAQLEDLIAAQEEELASLQEQIESVVLVGREVTPLMLDMLDSLAEFVSLDVPFLADERQQRIERLRTMMDRADVADSEKFRRLLEAFQIENEYGRTIEAYQGELELDGENRVVDFLRIGRVALLYQSRDGERLGAWNPRAEGGGAWEELPGSYRGALREGLRIARKQKAPDLIPVPVPAPKEVE